MSTPPAGARRLRDETRAWLRASLERADALAALPFLEAVVEQTAVPLGAAIDAAEAAERERGVGREALELLLGCRPATRPDERAAARLADRLHRRPALLAAFFQNLDLLHAAGYAHADGVSVLLLHALELAYDPLE